MENTGYAEASGAGAFADAKPPVSTDELFDVLARERRRHVLRCLLERAEPVALGELASAVARREAETADEAPPLDRVRMSLYHTHLPRLADAGAVKYDAEREVVAPGRLAPYEPYLDLVSI